MLQTVFKVLTRKKVLDPVSAEQSQLGRVLNTYDLTALGVGSTLGVGVYVLAGHVAKDTAGPAVVISFLIATIASVFAGLCYAEFGARAPRAGSAYIYSYVCVGEFVAFVIGWNLILEYIIGSASVARGLSLYLDTLLNHTLENTFREIAPINAQYMSEYFDFFAFGISVILSIALAFGMKESSIVNNIFTLINLGVVLFVVIAGSIKADPKNWDLDPPANRTDVGSGGFFPFGVEGMIKGAATCFYGFVGFDCIATTGEEVKNPKRAIPTSIVLSLFIIFLAYFSTSTVITMMIPYYDQDPDAPIPFAFESIGWDVAKWVVAIGGIFGLCASLFGAMFPLPRILYAMASDGIIFQFLGKVSERFKTPVIGTLLAGLFTGLMGALFELKQLVDMMSIGTLLAYTIVAASVLLLRYEIDKSDDYQPLPASDSEENEAYTESSNFPEIGSSEELELTFEAESNSFIRQIFNCGRNEQPTSTSEKLVTIEVCIYCVLCILVGLCAIYLKTPLSEGEVWAITLTVIVVCITVLVVMSIATQPKSQKELSFKVPLVPLIPALSILINIYLMLMLDPHTWIRFAVWMAVGIPTYYFSVKNQCHFAQNKSISSRLSLADTLSNGRLNRAFVSDEKPELFINGFQQIDEKQQQQQQQLQQQTSISSVSNGNSLPPAQREAIAQLEEVIHTFENDTPLPDMSNNLNNNNNTSNNSSSHEENVEADVHRSASPNVTIFVDPTRPQDSRHEFIVETIDIQPILFTEPVVNVYVRETATLDTPPPSPVTPQPPVTQQALEELIEEKVNESVIPKPPPLINLLSENITKPEILSDQQIKDITIPPPETEPVLTEEQINGLIPEPPSPGPYLIKDTERIVIPRPRHNPKEVTLRHVPKKKKPAPEVPQEERVNNLKPSDPQTKQFREKLQENLRVIYSQKIIEDAHRQQKLRNSLSHPVNKEKNENVIDSNIDREDAKEKLAKFLEKDVAPEVEENQPKISETNEVDEGIKETKESVPISTNVSNQNDYRDLHNRNMQDIFKSIRLKQTDKDD